MLRQHSQEHGMILRAPMQGQKLDCEPDKFLPIQHIL